MTTDKTLPPAFQPFTWANVDKCGPVPAGHVINTVSTLRDLMAGSALVMEMLEREDIGQSDPSYRPLFDSAQRGDLLRFAITAMRVAAAEADEVLSGMETHYPKPVTTR